MSRYRNPLAVLAGDRIMIRMILAIGVALEMNILIAKDTRIIIRNSQGRSLRNHRIALRIQLLMIAIQMQINRIRINLLRTLLTHIRLRRGLKATITNVEEI